MRGKVVRRIKLTDNEGNVLIDEISSMSTQEVYEVWQYPGTGMELLTRRCKMYQGWARDVQEHQQIIATLFGRFAWESRDTVRNGVVMQHSNSFSLQFQRDMKECFRMVEYVRLFSAQECDQDILDHFC